MEDTLGVRFESNGCTHYCLVLILVIMEDTLGEVKFSRHHPQMGWS